MSGARTGSSPLTTQTIRQMPLAASASTIGVIDTASYTTTTRGSSTWSSVSTTAVVATFPVSFRNAQRDSS